MNFKHGHRTRSVTSRTYRSYRMMIFRCDNPKFPGFANYGGRGIQVCDRWRNSFEAFLQDMGTRPEGTSLGRIDNNGNYEPGNCRWETRKQQQNNMRSNYLIEYDWFVMTLAEWAECLDLKYDTLRGRFRNGWSVKDALSLPVTEDTRIHLRQNATNQTRA